VIIVGLNSLIVPAELVGEEVVVVVVEFCAEARLAVAIKPTMATAFKHFRVIFFIAGKL